MTDQEMSELVKQVEQLKQINSELYEALWAIVKADEAQELDGSHIEEARAALAKARGEA